MKASIHPVKAICYLFLTLFAFSFAMIFTPAQSFAYDYSAQPSEQPGYPGVYFVKAKKGADKATIGIPSLDKNSAKLENGPTTESPAIIMGAAVPYEKRVGFTEFERIDGGSLYPPYSNFRYTITNEQNLNGTGTHKKMSGFDGSYVFIRVDVSEVIQDAPQNSYLHVMIEKNKALMPSVIHVDWKDPDGFAAFTDTAFGTKAAVYSLANNAASLKDKTGADTDTPYIDLLIYSSGTLVAGADTGSTAPDAMSADFGLKMYVDETQYYNNTTYDPNYQPKQGEPTMAQLMLAKYYKDDQPTDASYKIIGNDLELEIMVDKNKPTEYWSLRKALAYQSYDKVPIKMICEVPVLTGLTIEGHHVIFDVNSFDIQIANHQTTGEAALTVQNGILELTDSFETTGAELAVGNNASIFVKSGGELIITPKCQLEVEYDAASAAPGSGTTPPDYNVGVLTIENGGKITNNGVITIEGTEGKPLDPLNPTARGEMKEAKVTIEEGGTLENNGCLLCNGALYNKGTLINNGKYDDTITTQDPDKGSFTYHKGIQLSWKDDVTQKSGNSEASGSGETTQKSVTMGHLHNGAETGGTNNGARIENNGDIVLVPGVLNNYAILENTKDGNIWICGVKEAVIPIQAKVWQPSITEKRIKFEYPITSDMLNFGQAELTNAGTIGAAEVAIVSNGRTGNKKQVTEGEMFEAAFFSNVGHMVNSGDVTLSSVRNYGRLENSGSIKNRVMLSSMAGGPGTLVDTASTKLTNVYTGAKTVNGNTNTWTHAPCASFTITPITQESEGGKAVKWIATATPEGTEKEGVQYLLDLYESNMGMSNAEEYTIFANQDNELTSPTLPEVAIGQNIVYYFMLGDGYDSLLQEATVKVTATPVVIAPAPIKDLVYNGEDQVLTTAGYWDNETMQYKVNDGEWQDAVPTAKNAGSYTVSYKKKDQPDTSARQLSEAVVIEKCPVTLSADDIASKAGEPRKELTWTANGLPGEEKIAAEDVTIQTDADTAEAKSEPYSITVQLAETAAGKYPNYEITTKNGNYYVTTIDFIAKDYHDIFKDDTTTEVYKGYNIQLLFPTAGNTNNTTPPEGISVYYSYNTDGTATALTPDNYQTNGVTTLAVLPAKAGIHTVYFYITDAADGKTATIQISGSKQVFIEKAKQTAPADLTKEDETYLNSGDGKIGKLTPRSMEYRDKFNEGSYKTIYEETIEVRAGTYLVRKIADENHYASPDTEIVIQKGGAITVSFDSAGGTEIANATVAACGDVVVSPATQPVFEGATFLGWYLDKEAYDFKTPVTENITLTAAWAPTAFILPKSTTAIKASAFQGLTVKAIGIPYGCESIGANAFQDCKNLTVIVIPSSVTAEIPDSAFANCSQKIYVYGVNGSEGGGNSEAERFCDKDVAHRNQFTFVGYIDYPAPQPQTAGE